MMENGKNLGDEPNDYLWDGSGEPDPDVQKLETLLGKYRHDRSAPPSPTVVPEERWSLFPWLRFVPVRLRVAATGAVLAAIAMAGFVFYRTHRPDVQASWIVSPLSGTPRIEGLESGEKHTGARLAVGQLLETDSQSRANLRAEGVGQIEVEPNTRVRLLMMGELKRIALDHGTIQAFIWSPPGEFVVDTPSATTVDLGCAYTLHVDDSGAGTLRTTLGWVGFELNGRESFIPAGAACATRPHVGPGTPYFEDATPEFREALSRFDFEDSGLDQRANDLKIILAQARKRDVLTLWHLLSRVEQDQREHVYDRLAQLAPPPAGVTREGILRLDQPMLDQWWNSLGFDDIAIWRHWEHAWGGESGREK